MSQAAPVPSRNRLAAVIASAACAFWLYALLPDRTDQLWAYYVAEGALIMAMGGLLRVSIGLPLLFRWIEIEGAQQAICGTLTWGVRGHGDVCVSIIGRDVYVAALSFCLAGIITLWPRLKRN